MWRFILVTFAFLGWSFYVLSGGSDYEPRTQSWQARAKLDDVRPLARPAPVDVAALPATAQPVVTPPEVSRAETVLDTLQVSADNLPTVTLASLEPVVPQLALEAFEADPQKVEDLTATAQPEREEAIATDMREVTGTVVNMRDGPSTFYLAIGKLKQGEAVEVLADNGEGWLRIRVAETGQTGWMADWLVTAAHAN